MFFILFWISNCFSTNKYTKNNKAQQIAPKLLENDTPSLCPKKNESSIELEENNGYDKGNVVEASKDLYACEKNLKRLNGYLCVLHIYYCSFKGLQDKSDNGGGAIFMFTNSDKFDSKTKKFLNIEHCTFDNCQSLRGGAISIYTLQNTRCFVILQSTFTNNQVTSENGYGGAISFNATKGQIENCKFINNKAKNGGDIYYLFSATSTNTIHSDQYLIMKNNEFTRNDNDDEITNCAIYLDWHQYSKIDFINNKIETTKKIPLFGYKGNLVQENISISENFILPDVQSIINPECSLFNHFRSGFKNEYNPDEPDQDTTVKKPTLTEILETIPTETETLKTNEKPEQISTDTPNDSDNKLPIITETDEAADIEIPKISNTLSSNNGGANLESSPNNKKRQKTIWLIVGIILAVIVVLVIIIIIILMKRKNNDSKNQNSNDMENVSDNEVSEVNSLGEKIPSVEIMNVLYNSEDHKNDAFDCSESINEDPEIKETPQTNENPPANEKKKEYVYDPNDISEIWV